MKMAWQRYAGLASLSLLAFIGVMGVHSTSHQPLPDLPASTPAPITCQDNRVDYHFHTLAGENYSSQSQRGRIVLLFFGASWCQPCRTLLPWWNDLWLKFHASQVVLLAVSIDRAADVWANYLKQHHFTFPSAQLSPTLLPANSGWKQIPMLLLLDRQGKIYKRYIGLRMQDAPLSTLIQELLEQSKSQVPLGE